MAAKLFVGNLPFQASEQNLRELFAQAGAVESVKIITNASTNQSRGFGFVEMSSADEARKAIDLFNGKPFMERSLTVSEAKPQSSHRPSGDRGGWRR
ncbi:MAG: RNA-binding protein [Candidatus Rokubacteria bacterium]|nr:RNA-binding protein [Candidatus Rokubacteria bacterium]